jgi:hypothetical protein
MNPLKPQEWNLKPADASGQLPALCRLLFDWQNDDLIQGDLALELRIG